MSRIVDAQGKPVGTAGDAEKWTQLVQLVDALNKLSKTHKELQVEHERKWKAVEEKDQFQTIEEFNQSVMAMEAIKAKISQGMAVLLAHIGLEAGI
jgi:hypothetical protein